MKYTWIPILIIISILFVGTVSAATPVANFTVNGTYGIFPITGTYPRAGFAFSDMSTNTPTSWNWTFTNVSPGNGTQIGFSTSVAPSLTLGVGNWSIKLNASNVGGYNITPPRYIRVLSPGGVQIFPTNSIWNTPINASPVHASSATWIATLYSDSSIIDWNRRFYYNVVDAGVPHQYMNSFEFSDESDDVPYPIPVDPLIETEWAPGEGDYHMLMLDKDSHELYEINYAVKAGSVWNAGAGAVWDYNSNALRPAGWTSTDAAGLPVLPLLIRYDEVVAGTINHALRLTIADSNPSYVWSATHYASYSSGEGRPGMGQVFRLKSSVDISGFTPQAKVIAQALKTYGMIVADNGAYNCLSMTPDSRWDDDDLGNLYELDLNDFEAVNVSGLMVSSDSAQVSSSGSAPTAAFSANVTSGVTPLSVKFTDSSTNTPTAWKWYWFANETVSSTSQSPATMLTTGLYNVRLNASNAYGWDYENKTAYINVTSGVATPVANFAANVTSGTTPLAVGFTDSSTNTPTTWKWYWYGNETLSSSSQNPTTILTTGLYNVRLNASNSAGYNWKNQTSYINVTSVTLPVISIGCEYTTMYQGGAANCWDSVWDELTPQSWVWDFETEYGTHVYRYTDWSHASPVQYTVVGSYDLRVNATNASGTSSVFYPNLFTVLSGNPTSAFSANVTSGSVPLNVAFTSSSTSPYPTITKHYEWYWYNNETLSSTSTNPSAVFIDNGFYSVRLKTYTTSTLGTFLDWENKTNYIYADNGIPVANFTMARRTVLIGRPTQLIDTSTNTPDSWLWKAVHPTLGDDYTDTTQNPNYTFSKLGWQTLWHASRNATLGTAWSQTSRDVYVTTGYWNWTEPGHYSWDAPPDVTSVVLQIAGGGGSGKSTYQNYYRFIGYGGFAGEYTTRSGIIVVPDKGYNIIVGTGGIQSEIDSPSHAGTYSSAFNIIMQGGAGGLSLPAVQNSNGTAGAIGFLTGGNAAAGGNSGSYYGGSAGTGYGAGGGGGAASVSTYAIGGRGSDGYVGIILPELLNINIPDFTADIVTGNPGTLIHFTDMSILQDIPATYEWSFGDGTTSNTSGSVQHVFTYLGSYDVSLTINGTTNGISTMTKPAYINIVAAVPGKINTLYPREVSFTLVDRYGRAIPNLPVTVTMLSSSTDNTNWLVSMFGLADVSINSTILYDTTDDNGGVVFPMIASGRYNMVFYDPTRGISESRTVHPDQEDYIYILSTSDTAIATNKADYINTDLSTYPPRETNPSTVYLVANYTDLSGTTTNATFFIIYPNQTLVYHTSSTASVMNNQYAVANVKGAAYVWGIEATTTRFGVVNKVMGITLAGNAEHGLSNNLVRQGCNNWACT
jgi:PKD repeat protein